MLEIKEPIVNINDLFELIFELDRRLQVAQNYSSPLSALQDAITFLNSVLLRTCTNADVVDTVFLKMVDFFIKCNCNYKRSFISESINNATWLSLVKNRCEPIKRLASLWDQTVLNDPETCLQILILFSASSEIFFNQSVIPYGIFNEALSAFGTVSGFIYESAVLLACSKYLERLFQQVLEFRNNDNNSEVDELISFSNLVALILRTSLNGEQQKEELIERHCSAYYKILILSTILSDSDYRINYCLPSEIKEEYSNLLIYLK